MFQEYIQNKEWFDKNTSCGTTKYGHLIIEQKTKKNKSTSVVLYEDTLKYIYSTIKKALKQYDKNIKIWDKCEYGTKTKIFIKSIRNDTNYLSDEIVISQNDKDCIKFDAILFLEILDEIKNKSKKNEEV